MKAELIDSMGSDLTVVNAARVSFDKESYWAYNPDYDPMEEETASNPSHKLSDSDKRLIKYLATHNHWTPFSHVMITMRETVPIFVARQRFKHMVGFTYNEVSRRYVDDEPEFYVPDVWRKRAENKKQGSSDEEVLGIKYEGKHLKGNIHPKDAYTGFIEAASIYYNNLIANGVAPEQARMVLPQSMYTSYYVTGSLAAWARAYKLRIDEHSQKEIQDLAKQWDEIIKNIPEFKHSWEALTNKEV